MLIAEPAAAHALLERVTRTTVRYLRGQVAAGAQALQLFDSWAGLLGVDEYREFGLRYARQVLDELADLGVPRIYFALNSSHLTDEVAKCGADVIGVDWRQPLDRVSAALGGRFPLQGNLDPCALFAPPAVIEERARRVLGLARGLPGHIFNLGHGILPETPIEGVETLVRTVRES